jgi:hypothetical protein
LFGPGAGVGGPFRGSIFGFELPDFSSLMPNIDMTGKLKNLKEDLLKMLPEWMLDPKKWIIGMLQKINKVLPAQMQSEALMGKAGKISKYEALISEAQGAVKEYEKLGFGRFTSGPRYEALEAARETIEINRKKIEALNRDDLNNNNADKFGDAADKIGDAGLRRLQALYSNPDPELYVNASRTTVHAPQTNMNVVGTPIVPDNPIIRAVNASAFT